MASRPNGTLYVGVTSDLKKRVFEHKTKLIKGFTQKYDVNRLVWFEEHDDIESAIQREKNIKEWHRSWKLRIINKFNPTWKDLSEELFDWIPAFAGMTGKEAKDLVLQVGNDNIKERTK